MGFGISSVVRGSKVVLLLKRGCFQYGAPGVDVASDHDCIPVLIPLGLDELIRPERHGDIDEKEGDQEGRLDHFYDTQFLETCQVAFLASKIIFNSMSISLDICCQMSYHNPR